MKSAYFDCFSGISGDMTVAALIDAGADFHELKKILSGLNLHGYEIFSEKTRRSGIEGTRFIVEISETHSHRNLNDINSIIMNSSLPEKVKNDAISIFTILATAEATVHGTVIEEVHFHEVGAIDSIIDICGAASAIWMLGIKSVSNSPVNTGKGFTKTGHGILPVPAPATAELLKGTEIYSDSIETELATPTGAAILSYYSSSTRPIPRMTISSIGYGAGTKELSSPNLLRIFVGNMPKDKAKDDRISEIETSIDDMNPEFYTHLIDELFKKGALDVNIIPAYSKKNRPASIIKVLSPVDKTDLMTDILFRETTTSGIRIQEVKRKKLERRIIAAETRYGEIRVKIHEYNGEVVTVSPEYEDCRNAAEKSGVSVKTVYMAAQNAALFKT